MALERVKATTPIDEIAAIFDRDGGVIVEGMVPRTVVEPMRDAVLAAREKFAAGGATQGLGEPGRAFAGAKTVRFSSLGRLSPAFFDMVENPVLGAVADRYLLPLCGSYWINTGQAMLIGPGEKAQSLHRDCLNWVQYCAPLWPNCPEVTVSSMIALEEVTETMGATRVIPGSHLWQRLDDNGSQEQTVPAELAPGDALVYSGKVVHGGGANRTPDRWRHAMHLSFLVGWLVPEEATPIDYSPELVKGLSPRVQRMLGFRSYDPRPHYGGGLWLKHANKLEDVLGLA